MTDGILLQEMKADYHLSRYDVIMVDEAHERSLNIDFILGLLKRVLRERPTFKVIVSSATINAEIFSEYFDECPVVKIDAITYPVEVIHDPPEVEGDYDQMQQKIEDIVDATARKGEPGDILIFLPGEKAIKDCAARVQALPGSRDFEILPLYSRLAAEEQERVFADFPGKRKVIIATNIAETSVTIDGVRTVIDPGVGQAQLLQPADLHLVADRSADLQGLVQPAQGPRRPHGAGGLLPPLQPGGLRAAGAVHPRGDPAHRPLGGRAAHGGARHHGLRELRVPRRARPRGHPQRDPDAQAPRRASTTDRQPHEGRRDDVPLPPAAQARAHDRGGDPAATRRSWTRPSPPPPFFRPTTPSCCPSARRWRRAGRTTRSATPTATSSPTSRSCRATSAAATARASATAPTSTSRPWRRSPTSRSSSS